MMIERVNSELKKQIQLIISDMHDPRIAGELLSVTDVSTTADLKYATVFVAVGENADCAAVLKTLQSAAGFMRNRLKELVLLRVIPELRFKEDESAKYGRKIDDILNGLKINPKDGD